MVKRASFGTIRSRVALSHAALVMVVLLIFVGLASSEFWWHISHQLYRHAIQNVETAEGLLYFTPDGELHLREDYHNHPQSRLVQERLVEILDYNTGKVLFRNELLGDRNLGGAPFKNEGVDYSPRSLELDDGSRVLMVSHIHNLGGHVLLIRQAYSIDPLIDRLKEFVVVLCFTLPFALLFAGWAGLRVAAHILRPLDQMIVRAEAISPNRLDERLPVSNPDHELGRLAIVINGLLQRLENDFNQLKRFTLDVSHELRTPLAALRSVGEVGLQQQVSDVQYRDIIGSMLEEANRLTRLIDNLLTISRMNAGQIPLDRSEVDVFEVVSQCVSLLEVLALEKSQHLTLNTEGNGAARANALMLRQAIMNVVHNAIKYTSEGGSVEVRAALLPSRMIEIRVTDNGPGIPAQEREKIFDRFYRSSADQTGAGLGLAISRWIVEAHEGMISVSENPSGGSCFSIQLPSIDNRAFTERKDEKTRVLQAQAH